MLIARFAKRSTFVRSAFFLPVVLPSATVVMLWQAYLSDLVPPFSSLLPIFLWKYSGLNIILILTALIGIDGAVTEAAMLDGAGFLRTTVYIHLPIVTPTLFSTFVLSLVNSTKIFRESFLLYSEYPDRSVYMLQNYLNNHFEKLNYQNISTAAVVFAIVVYTVVAILFTAEKKWSERI